MSRSTPPHESGFIARPRRSIDARRDDSVVRCWDAVIRGDAGAATAASPDSFDVIQRLRARDDALEPRADFLERLENELVAASPRMPRLIDPAPARVSMPRSTAKPGLFSPGRHSRFGHRLAPIAIALALLLVLLTAIPLAIQQSSEPPAIPAAIIPQPTLETMAQFEFSPPFWGMPDGTTWDHMDLSIIRIDPGASFSTNTDWYKAADGPLILLVQNGELVMRPAGPALVYSANHPDSPAQVDAGTETVIGPNETIIYSTAGAATGRNLGDEPVYAAIGSPGKSVYMKEGDIPPTDVTSIDLHFIDTATLIGTKDVTVSIRRARLQPLDSFVFSPDPAWKYVPAIDPSRIKGLTIAAGAIDGWSPDIEDQRMSSAAALMLVKPATFTLFNLGEEPVDIYFLVIEPYPPPAASTPTP